MIIPAIESLELLPDLYRSLPDELEFVAFDEVSAASVAACCRLGYLPMGFPEQERWLLVKCHSHRMFLTPGSQHVSRRTRSRARGHQLRISCELGRTLEQIARQHADNWITAPLADAWKTLAHRDARSEASGGPRESEVRFLAVEAYDRDDSLVAGEIGYLCGSVYTSVSGWHGPSGSGSAQLALLGQLLARAGVALWDLGMYVPYKEEMGALAVPRDRWVERYRRHARETRETDGDAADPLACT